MSSNEAKVVKLLEEIIALMKSQKQEVHHHYHGYPTYTYTAGPNTTTPWFGTGGSGTYGGSSTGPQNK